MDQPLKETSKEVYAEPTLQEREQITEVTEGNRHIVNTSGIPFK